MTKQVIDIGVQGNDGTGDSIRESFRKVNDNFNEIYAVFGAGGTIGLRNLSDGTTYTANQVIMGSLDGSALSARTLVQGDGIVIDDFSDNTTLRISSTVAGLSNDPTPTLGSPLNTNGLAIGRVADPTPALVAAFNTVYPNSQTTINQLVISKGYADSNYLGISNGIVTSSLRVKAQPVIPPVSDPDYDPTLTSNYLSSEAMQRKDVVYRGGDTMTGKLNLSDHPAPMAGFGPVNGSDDLQAATKFYVDNSTYSSNVNLYVTTYGDDLQRKTPSGKEGRAWHYAYKTVSAAALQAENLISLASQEPGPYRQRITYTIGPDQTFSTIQNATLTGGNSTDAGYTHAYDLLQANKEFIQTETIAYLNKKYVNTFSYNKNEFQTAIINLIDGVGYDLVLDTTFNTTKATIDYFDPTNLNDITNQLIQTIDGIKFARDQILGFSFNSTNLSNYIGQVIDAVSYDLVFQSNYQSIQVGLAFSVANTNVSIEEILDIITDLKTKILALTNVTNSPTATTALTNAFTVVLQAIEVGAIPSISMPGLASTPVGKTSARDLLLNNITFVQAETVAFLAAEYPNLTYDRADFQLNVKFVMWSIIYDAMYNGNQQSVFVAQRYLNSIPANEKTATVAAIGYINTLAQAIITNGTLPAVYQQAVKQYRNETLSGGSIVSTSISTNIASIQSIVQTNATVTVVNPTTTSASSVLQTCRNDILAKKTDYRNEAVAYVNNNFSVINDPIIIASITSLFQIPIDGLTNGLPTVPVPTYTSPSGLDIGFIHARQAILANLSFLADETIGWTKINYPTFTPSVGWTVWKRNLMVMLESVCYDITYGGSSASGIFGYAYWLNDFTTIAGEQPQTAAAVNQASTIAILASQNSLISTLYGTGISVGTGVGNGTTVTLTFADQGDRPFNIGESITVSGLTGINGIFTVTAATNTTVSYSSGATGTFTGSGNVKASQTRNSIWADGTTAAQAIGALLTEISDIILNNTNYSIVYPVTTGYALNLRQAQAIMIASEADIAVATVGYIDNTFPGGFNYDEATCRRDVGLIIDGMSIDLVTGGTWQSVYAGKSYYKNASAKAIAIGTQYTETVDGISFAKSLGLQVLNQTTATRNQTLVAQVFNSAKSPSNIAKTTFSNNMDTVLNIINFGFGAAPAATFGTGIWNVTFNNGGNGYVDQGVPTNNDIIPAKVIVGLTSTAYASIVKYIPGVAGPNDTIQCRLTKPGFFTPGEQIEFGETVSDLHITIFVESGVYYEDYPIRLPQNVSIKGDEFRRTIIRPRDRISQSPWRKVFFYRDAIIDAMELGLVNYSGANYATNVNASVSGTTNKVVITLASGQAPASWIGKVFADNYTINGNAKRGKAVVDSVSGNFMNCTVIYPFQTSGTKLAGEWFLFDTTNYGRHYLTNPLDITSTAKNNKDIDVILCNDATRVSNLTFQGHGGFAMVLDPEGQIKTKSPYGQVCSSFSQSNNRKRFAGGQFVDGFAGRLRGTIINIADNGITVTVQGTVNSGLDIRPPSPPCAFFVSGFRYQVNDVVSFNAATATVVLTLDTATPYNAAGSYDNVAYAANVSTVIDTVAYDMVLGSNYQSVAIGIEFANLYTSAQKAQAIAGFNYARSQSLVIAGGNSTATTAINDRYDIITSIIDSGLLIVPSITYPNPVGVLNSDDIVKAKNIIIANKEFIKTEITSWISATYAVKLIPNYSAVTYQQNVGYIVDALVYDLFYAGNSQSKKIAETYWVNTVSRYAGQESFISAAYGRLKTILQQIVAGSTVAKSAGNNKIQVTTNPPVAPSIHVTRCGVLMDIVIDYVFDGDYDSPVTTVNPTITGQDSALQTIRTNLISGTPTIQTNTIVYLNNGGGLAINIEMGGNKSMLANDFAMINDLGYAILCTNGGLSEQVSTFSYYCHTHYWANNGGQIRSVAGSNAHGNYGLRASGYDVTELPDAVNLANNMVQTAHIYKAGIFKDEMTPTVSKQSLSLYIVSYDYAPMAGSEVEIDHSLAGLGIVRYEMTSAERTSVTIGQQNILKLNLSTAGNNGTSSTGLAATLYDGQLITIRILQQAKYLNIANVNPTRPSTALQYNDNLADIYRILAYNLTDSTGEELPATIAVLQSDASFNYYKFTTDITATANADPTITSASGTFVSIAGLTSGSTFIINNVTGTITTGLVIGGQYFAGQLVTNVSGSGSGPYTITFSGSTLSGTPFGNIFFSSYTQGSAVGDVKIAVLQISAQGTIDQINKGTYVFGWNGRVHRAISYTPPTTIATGTFVSGNVGSNILQVNNVAGTIDIGDLVTGTGFTSGQLVTNVALLGGTYTLTLSGAPDSPPSGQITFGILQNGYIEVDANPVNNNAADGTIINAMTYNSSVAGTAVGSRLVTFDIPYSSAGVLPVVDSYLKVANNAFAKYNGDRQVSAIANKTTITVASTSNLSVGMVVTSITPGAVVPNDCIIQSIDNSSQFTVSPAAWLPTGATLSATVVATVDRVVISNSGSNYTSAPTLTFTGGNPIRPALAVCTVFQGSIDSVTLVSPGYGYASTPLIQVSGGGGNNAQFTAVLTAAPQTTATVNGGANTVQMTLAYATDPGVSGTATATTSSFAVLINSSITGTTLSVGTVSSGTIVAGMYLTGGTIPQGIFIVSGSGTSWTVNQTVTATGSITINATANLITVSSTTGLAVGDTITFSGTSFGSIQSSVPYYITTVVSSSNQISVSTSNINSTATTTVASATSATTNLISLGSVTGITAGDPIVFTAVTGSRTISATTSVNTGTVTVSSSTNLIQGESIVFTSVTQTPTILATNTTGSSVTLSSTSGLLPGASIIPAATTAVPNATATTNASFTTSGGTTISQSGATVITGTIVGTTLTVVSVSSGAVALWQTVTGAGIAAGTYITAGSGTTWTVSIPNAVSSITINLILNTLTVGTVTGGTPAIGHVLTGGAVTAGTWITSLIAGSGTGSTWTVSLPQSLGSTAVNGTLNLVTIGATSGLAIGQSFVTGGSGNFGGLGLNTTYFVTKVISNTQVGIGASYGATSDTVLSTATGTIAVTIGGVLGGLVSGTTYYIASITGNTAVLSASASLTPTVTLTNGSTLTTGWTSLAGSIFGGLVSGTTYYIASIASNNLTLSTSPTLTPIVPLTQGAGAWTAVDGTVLGGLVSNNTYYVLTVNTGSSQITVSSTFNGSVFALTNGAAAWIASPGGRNATLITGTGTMPWYNPKFSYGTAITLTGAGAPSGTGPYAVTFTFGSTTAPATNKYYRISGNSNTLYNGLWLCTGSSTTSITLQYPNTPGTYGTGTTIVTREDTNGTSNTLGISKPFGTSAAVTLRLGYPAGSPAQITTRISTCRATGHDFLDIGTGSYSTTNYPYQIYGNPAQSRQPQQETNEEGVGRCFYVTSDQNGIFRVGKFFTVDQGTGTVTFSASIALSNLDGLGFKRGVVVSEFSTDNTMTNNAPEIVPVQSAVRGYIDKRLGLDHGGSPMAISTLIGPGFMALNGSLPMKGTLNMATFNISNLSMPSLVNASITDAVNRDYVDSSVSNVNALYKLADTSWASSGTVVSGSISSTTVVLKNFAGTIAAGYLVSGTGFSSGQTVVSSSFSSTTGNTTVIVSANPNSTPGGVLVFTSPTLGTGDLLVYNATTGKWRNADAPTGDVNLVYNATTNAITTAIQSNVIVNSMVSPSAAIAQSKLALNDATAAATSGAAIKGIASFNSANFNSATGYISIAASSITKAQMATIGNGTVLGNFSGSASNPLEVTASTVISQGNGILNTPFASAGAMVLTSGTGTISNIYGIIPITTSRAANSLIRSDAGGEVDVAQLKVDGYKIIDTTSTTVNFFTPGAFGFMDVVGTTGSNTSITTYGTLNTNNGTLQANKLTTGATATVGTITGNWQVLTSSIIDVTAGTLRSLTLTTGADATSGTIQGNWSLVGSSKLQATYADLAEFYEGDQEYEAGTVLVFGGDKEVTTTTQLNDTRSAGVVTTNPAYVMNSEQTGIKVCLALAGRVPCKVVGRVKKGDMLTTSATPGYAVKALTPTLGAIIGKALEDKDYGEAGVIQVAVGRV